MDSPPPSRESGDTAPLPLANNSTGLINDLMSGKPILSQLSAAVASGDAQAVEDVQSKNSYNLSLESVDKVLQGADPGPKFDIRLGKPSLQVTCENENIFGLKLCRSGWTLHLSSAGGPYQ